LQNNAPALVIQTPVRLVVYVFGCDTEGRIAEVYAVLNPDKLRHAGLSGP
jgi:RNA polymerase sigma-70 factor (ECF subfamily)